MIAPDIVIIPEGSFFMGSERGPDNEQPRHRVWLSSYGIGRFAVTNKEYRIFLEKTRHSEPPFYRDPVFSAPDQPVVGVSWYDACAYCRWLGEQTGAEFRLPTEAEWERAARGGLEGALYPWGDEAPWEKGFVGCSAGGDGPAPVGVNKPNGFGLYDMSEGVHEWCGDYYDYFYYRRSPERNPQGPPSGARRASRGGSWRHRVKFSRCAARSSLPPGYQYADYGFRVAMSVESHSLGRCDPSHHSNRV
ncbi:MAG TPA: formylglycine-generating enzyme family protein [Methylomirabilota bacterium]|nr:formylglycine-generating enzyme family protein [Methylomirabilota bacterium]